MGLLLHIMFDSPYNNKYDKKKELNFNGHGDKHEK